MCFIWKEVLFIIATRSGKRSWRISSSVKTLYLMKGWGSGSRKISLLTATNVDSPAIYTSIVLMTPATFCSSSVRPARSVLRPAAAGMQDFIHLPDAPAEGTAKGD